MADGNWRPDDGPGDGHGPDLGDGTSSSSRSVPIYVLFLIMLASGIFTLVFLWICVQCIYRRRRIRRSRADIERNAAAQQPWQAEAPADGALAKDLEADVKRCDASEVELTYVVMAGEEQPTFLAKPLRNTNSEEEKPSVSSPTKFERDEALVAAKPDKTSGS